MRILVTGSSGFIGNHLISQLEKRKHHISILNRGSLDAANSNQVVNLSELPHLTQSFDAIVHLAGLAHISEKSAKKKKLDFEESNVSTTEMLCAFAKRNKVGKFINLSSIAVVSGAQSDCVIDDCSAVVASTQYSKSKHAGEQIVQDLKGHGIFAISLRPPMVIGQNAKGNWARLIKLCALGIPLPFRGVNNRRSVIGVEDLCAKIVCVIERDCNLDDSGNYSVSNPNTVSIKQILTNLGEALEKPVRLFSVPDLFYAFGRKLPIIGRTLQSLTGNLEIDGSRFDATFDITRTIDLQEEIQASVRPYTTHSAWRRKFPKRLFDFFFASIGLLILAPVVVLLMFAIKLESKGPAVFSQLRVGKDQKPFVCRKLRTMKTGSAEVLTHKAKSDSITRLGRFLRKYKLDELPQLWNILRGEMSFVGPRPGLLSDKDLINERNKLDVYKMLP
ncbi:MAG: hybrid nucleoside-diphosphate sugar epimerase/sugar transferase, partial [Pseudomonadota bacterium]